VMPSGFTIHEVPAVRAIVYRINTVHRSLFGLVQKTEAHIYEQLQYSFHPKTDRADQWKVWCDYELFGAHSAGLALNDPHAAYRPNEFDESATGIFYRVTHGQFANLDPSPECTAHVPTPPPVSSTSPNGAVP
jgi:hypothetical protein